MKGDVKKRPYTCHVSIISVMLYIFLDGISRAVQLKSEVIRELLLYSNESL